MKVILLKDVPALGQAGMVKEVKDGYARNYLLPRGLAAEATESSLRTLAGQQRAQTERTQRDRAEAEKLAAALETAVIEISGRGGEGGRLFGAITAQDVAEALTRAGFGVTKKQVELNEPIKTAGFYKVPVRIGLGIVAQVDVNVVTAK
ncbi:MAG TPA: 50S ribosomal protein L9 [bacterium]|nr:50S ribosomal protein L9 [bacterium]